MRGQITSVAIALYITSIMLIALQIALMISGIALFDPLFIIILYMFMQEISKLLGQLGSDDGEDSNS